MYQAFIDSNSARGKSRREIFTEKLLSDKPLTPEIKEIRDNGERLISILDRLGYGLLHGTVVQRFLLVQVALRKRAICWFPHVAILVWEILGPYVIYRRTISGPKWAEYFIEYSLECAEEMSKQWKAIEASERKLVIKDHSGSGHPDYIITEDKLSEIQRELKDLLHRR